MSNSENQNSTQEVLAQPHAPAQIQTEPQKSTQTDGKGIASLVLGIISLVVLLFSFGGLGLISFILSVIGLSLGAISFKSNSSDYGKTLFNNFKSYLIAANCQYFYLFTDTNCNYMFYEGQKMLRHGTRNITLIKNDKPHPIDVFMYTGVLSVSQNSAPPRI